jgi:hypothetical protein
MKLVSRVVVFSAAFVLGAFTGGFFSASTVQQPYPQITVIDDREAHVRPYACKRRK